MLLHDYLSFLNVDKEEALDVRVFHQNHFPLATVSSTRRGETEIGMVSSGGDWTGDGPVMGGCHCQCRSWLDTARISGRPARSIVIVCLHRVANCDWWLF